MKTWHVSIEAIEPSWGEFTNRNYQVMAETAGMAVDKAWAAHFEKFPKHQYPNAKVTEADLAVKVLP